MKRIRALKLWIAITIPSTLVMLSNYFKEYLSNDEYLDLGVQVLIFVLSAATTVSIVDWLFTVPWLRRLLSDKYSVEGFWLVRTELRDEDDKGDTLVEHPILKDGVLYLTYHGKDLKLKAVTSRIDVFHTTDLVTSEVAFVSDREDQMFYLNYFRYNIHGDDVKHGVAFSEFNFSEPNYLTYVGKIQLENEQFLRKQSARRIKWKDYHQMRKKHGETYWIKKLLENKGDIAKTLE